MTENDTVLYRTAGGTSLHLLSCPHLQVTSEEKRIAVAPADQAGIPPCKWTADELAGTGRRYFTTLDEAFEALPVPLDNRARVREILATQKFDRFWLTNGGQYIGVGPTGGPAAAYVNRGFIGVRQPTGGYEQEQFPNYGGGSRGSSGSRSAEVPTTPCPKCRMALPATGKCDECDA